MRLLRVLAGLACIVAAVAITVLLAMGGFPGGGAGSPALMAHLPPVAFGLALLALGVWLLKGKR